MITSTSFTDQQLIDLAKEYVERKYFLVGETIYFYEIQSDPEDDATAQCYGTLDPCGEGREIGSSQVVDVKIDSAEVEERRDDQQEWDVTVYARVAIADENDDWEERSDWQYQDRTIYVYLCVDSDTGEVYADNAEE